MAPRWGLVISTQAWSGLLWLRLCMGGATIEPAGARIAGGDASGDATAFTCRHSYPGKHSHGFLPYRRYQNEFRDCDLWNFGKNHHSKSTAGTLALGS